MAQLQMIESVSHGVDALPVPEELAERVTSAVSTAGYTMAIVYSSEPLKAVREFINSYDPDGVPGAVLPDGSQVVEGNAVRTIRIDYKRDRSVSGDKEAYVETNRAIVTLKTSAYRALIEAGLGERSSHDFMIAEYKIRESNLPPVGCVYALFIPIPTELDPNRSASDKAELERQMVAKMRAAVNVEFVGPTDYRIHFPSRSRDERDGQYAGYIIVTFTSRVSKENCARIKYFLDMTFWYDRTSESKAYYCHVAWCRESAIARLNQGYSSSTRVRRPDMRPTGRPSTYGSRGAPPRLPRASAPPPPPLPPRLPVPIVGPPTPPRTWKMGPPTLTRDPKPAE